MLIHHVFPYVPSGASSMYRTDGRILQDALSELPPASLLYSDQQWLPPSQTSRPAGRVSMNSWLLLPAVRRISGMLPAVPCVVVGASARELIDVRLRRQQFLLLRSPALQYAGLRLAAAAKLRVDWPTLHAIRQRGALYVTHNSMIFCEGWIFVFSGWAGTGAREQRVEQVSLAKLWGHGRRFFGAVHIPFSSPEQLRAAAIPSAVRDVVRFFLDSCYFWYPGSDVGSV